jgi:hypothetical protein
MTGSAANRLAAERADTAVVAARTPVCVEKFLQNGDAQANLAVIKRSLRTGNRANTCRRVAGRHSRGLPPPTITWLWHKAMFSQALSRSLIASILLVTSISMSFAQNGDSDFIKSRNSYPFWNGSLKRDIQGFKPGMTETEAQQRLSSCEVRGHKVFCPVSSKDEGFELSLTEHTRPRVVKDVTYAFPAGDATLGTMAKNVMMQFGVGNSHECLPTSHGTSECSQWQLEDGSYIRLGVDVYRRNMFLHLSTPKWVDSLEEHALEKEQGRIPPRQF